MISGMLEAVNGSLNEELQLSIITNNLANIGVAGFKKDRLSFATELRNQLREGGETQAANFVQDQQLYRRTVTLEADLTQGTLQHTGNPLDLAISGEAFFKISTPDGIRYTRNGVFHLSEQGMIVTSEGHLVLGENGPVSVPEGELVVDERGGVSVGGEQVDTLALVAFVQSEKLEKEGQSLFRQSGDLAQERAPGEPTEIMQGYLEEANVFAAEELIMMLRTERSYEAHQKIIRALFDIDTKAINDTGRVR